MIRTTDKIALQSLKTPTNRYSLYIRKNDRWMARGGLGMSLTPFELMADYTKYGFPYIVVKGTFSINTKPQTRLYALNTKTGQIPRFSARAIDTIAFDEAANQICVIPFVKHDGAVERESRSYYWRIPTHGLHRKAPLKTFPFNAQYIQTRNNSGIQLEITDNKNDITKNQFIFRTAARKYISKVLDEKFAEIQSQQKSRSPQR